MTLFWAAAAGLILLGLILVAPALLRGAKGELGGRQAQNVAIARERLRELELEHERGELDAEGFAQARRELELALAADLGDETPSAPVRGGGVSVLLALLVLVPVLTVGLYQYIGSPQHIEVAGPGATAQAGNPHAAAAGQTASMDEMVQALADRLEREPNNPDGWYMLGRSYMSMGRYADAVKALERLREQIGDHPTALVMLADAVAMTQGGRVAGRPAELIQAALQQEPDNTTALWLAGNAAEEEGDYAQAVAYWRRAEGGLADQPELLAELRSMIAAAQTAGGLAPEPMAAATPEPTASDAAGAGPSLNVSVTLAPELAAKAQPDDVLYVFARAVEGPPMPLAAARAKVGDLPVRITLDDSMAMLPQMKLSNFEQVQVSARISKAGQPTAQSGDLTSAPQVVAVAAGVAVELVIDQQVP
jgi:cytochrome c-type biogenesis protein CcmH